MISPKRKPFNFSDLERDCEIHRACYRLDNGREVRELGIKVIVPSALYNSWPYNSSAYDFLQFLREEIFAYGTMEFPNLPLNKSNHTLAQRAPKQHAYSTNPYLTDICQSPHQDTPPWPTAFWLDEPRQYFSTWVLSLPGVEDFFRYSQQNPQLPVEDIHKTLVPQSLNNERGLLLNQTPGLLLIDNSDACQLYHARTCNFAAVERNPAYESDTAMYAFNEVGLLNYMDMLDSRRGPEYRDSEEAQQVQAFMLEEGLQ